MVEESYVEPVHIGKLGLELPEAISVNQKSFLAVGLHKAGSTLLAQIFRRIAPGYKYVPYDLFQTLRDLGYGAPDVAILPDEFFQPFGYAFIGFRGWVPSHSLPSWSKQRVVHLVRDPRDVVVSMYFSLANSHVAPPEPSEHPTANRRRFDAYRQTARGLDVDGFALEWADKVCKEYADTFEVLRPAAPRIWRYEDVIFAKVPWVKDMLRFLTMEPPPDDILHEIIRPFDVFPGNEDPESHIRQVKPGDHKAKLAGATIEQLTEKFAPVLKTYGYS